MVATTTTGLIPMLRSMSALREHQVDKSVCIQTDEKEVPGVQAADDMAERDMRTFQMMASFYRAMHEMGPITINNITAAKSETQHTVIESGVESKVPTSRPTMEIIGDMFNLFFSSGFNRVCFFGACGVGLYIYWSYLDHKWHMEEVQRRIDSNIVLRATQWLFESQPMKREVHSSFRLF